MLDVKSITPSQPKPLATSRHQAVADSRGELVSSLVSTLVSIKPWTRVLSFLRISHPSFRFPPSLSLSVVIARVQATFQYEIQTIYVNYLLVVSNWISAFSSSACLSGLLTRAAAFAICTTMNHQPHDNYNPPFYGTSAAQQFDQLAAHISDSNRTLSDSHSRSPPGSSRSYGTIGGTAQSRRGLDAISRGFQTPMHHYSDDSIRLGPFSSDRMDQGGNMANALYALDNNMQNWAHNAATVNGPMNGANRFRNTGRRALPSVSSFYFPLIKYSHLHVYDWLIRRARIHFHSLGQMLPPISISQHTYLVQWAALARWIWMLRECTGPWA